jgi:hypothetical protein
VSALDMTPDITPEYSVLDESFLTIGVPAKGLARPDSKALLSVKPLAPVMSVWLVPMEEKLVFMRPTVPAPSMGMAESMNWGDDWLLYVPGLFWL